MIELVEEKTQNSILEAMGRMNKRSEMNYPGNVLLISEENFYEIKTLPGYNPGTLYGKKVINYECGNIEGLVVVVSEEFKDKVYVADLPLNL